MTSLTSVMDYDPQDAPEDILPLYRKTLEGFNVVVGVTEKEGHTLLQKLGSWLLTCSGFGHRHEKVDLEHPGHGVGKRCHFRGGRYSDLITGVLGIYVGLRFDEVKRRPLYLVKETSNF